jgi:hypothetical protein
VIVNEIRSPIRSAIRSPIGPSSGTTFALDATATAIRAAILDPASYASGGWRLPGLAGARLSASARASVAMQQRRDDLLGPELVANGGFDSGATGWAGWNTNAAIAVASGQMTVTQPVGGNQVGVGNASAIATISGRRYRVSLDVISYTNSGQEPQIRVGDFNGGVNTTSGYVTAGTGTRTFEFTANTTTTYVNVATSIGAGNTITFDNVSVREVIVPALGWEFAPHNLLVQSEDFTAAAWSYSGSVTRTANTTVAPSGATTADTIQFLTTGEFCVQQYDTTTVGQTFTASAWLRADSPTTVRLSIQQSGGNVSEVVCNLTTAWQRFSATYTTTAGVTFVRARLTPDGNTPTFQAWGYQLNLGPAPTAYIPTTTTAVYGPAIDWLSGIGAYGLRSEEARTNLVLWSADMSNAVWQVFGTGATKVGAGTALGAMPMYRVNVGSVGGAFVVASAVFQDSFAVAAATTYTVSCVARAVAGTVPVRVGGAVPGGIVGNTSDITLTTTPQVLTATVTTVGAGTGQFSIRPATAGGVVGDIEVGGIMFEAGAFPTSPILTYNAAVTRAADTVGLTDVAWLSPTAGTFIGEAVRNAAATGNFPFIMRLSGTAGNRMNLGYLTASGAGWEVVTGGVDQASMYPLTTADARRVAGVYATNDFAGCVNGGSISTDAAGSPPTITSAWLGSAGDGGAVNQMNGHITRVRYAPRRLPNAQLQALTA